MVYAFFTLLLMAGAGVALFLARRLGAVSARNQAWRQMAERAGKARRAVARLGDAAARRRLRDKFSRK